METTKSLDPTCAWPAGRPVTIERRVDRYGLQRMVADVVKVTQECVVVRVSGAEHGSERGYFNRVTGSGMRGAHGRPGLGAAAGDWSDWRMRWADWNELYRPESWNEEDCDNDGEAEPDARRRPRIPGNPGGRVVVETLSPGAEET